jgi:hypothetical protein
MEELWRELKIGDKVRIVEWPKELHEDRLHADTLDLYKWLIDSGGVLTIVKIHDDGLPEGEIQRVINGVKHWDCLLLNHSGLETLAGNEI